MASNLFDWILKLSALESTFDVENKDVSVEGLRGRNPACPTQRRDSPGLVPPPPQETPREAAKVAAVSAVNGLVRALEEEDPTMVAARIAQAIAVAASTSRNHAAFVAAVTAVESCALLCVESRRTGGTFDQVRELTEYAIDAAVDTALAASGEIKATDPSPPNIRDTHAPEQRKPQQLQKGPFWVDWAISIGDGLFDRVPRALDIRGRLFSVVPVRRGQQGPVEAAVELPTHQY